jgi:hypothetical protein
VVIPRSFEDIEGSVYLLGEDQAGQVVGKYKLAEFDAGVLLSHLFRETIGPADGEDDFAAGLRECFFYVV